MNSPPEMPDPATPLQVPDYLHTSVAQLAQFRYMGRVPSPD